jgi:hypothetical protein
MTDVAAQPAKVNYDYDRGMTWRRPTDFFNGQSLDYARSLSEYIDRYYGNRDNSISQREAQYATSIFDYYGYTDQANMFSKMADYAARRNDWNADGRISFSRNYDELGGIARQSGSARTVDYYDFSPFRAYLQ